MSTKQGRDKASAARRSAKPSSTDGEAAHPTFTYQPSLINAKLKPPKPASAWVERAALLDRVGAAVEKKLVVVAAPSGSGKTTLLSQWYQRAAVHRAVAWLSLDERDNDPVRFFSYLSGAVRA